MRQNHCGIDVEGTTILICFTIRVKILGEVEVGKAMKYNIKHRKMMAFTVGAFIFFIFLILMNITEAYHDSNGYWSLSSTFIQNGHFALNPMQHQLNSSEIELFKLRGYVYPLILFLLKGFGLGGWTLYWIALAMLYSLGITYVLPETLEVISKVQIGAAKRIIPVLLVIFFWPGLVTYPLIDLPVTILSLTTALCAVKLQEKNTHKLSSIIPLSLGMGISLYASFNIRGSYALNIVAAIPIIGSIVWAKKWYVKIIVIFTVIGGIAILAIPQAQINYENYEVKSPANPLSLARADVGNGYLLYEGLFWTRYETVVNPLVEQPTIIPVDSIGMTIMKNEQVDLSDSEGLTISSFAKIAVKYPLEMLGIYTSHFANAMDSRYGEAYITDNMSARRYIKILANFAVWFLTISGCAIWMKSSQCQNIPNGSPKVKVKYIHENVELSNVSSFIKKYWVLLALVVMPVAVTLPGHIEPRYFLPFHILVYAYVSYFCPFKIIGNLQKRHPISSAVLFITLLGCCCAIWNSAFGGYANVELLYK